MSFFSFSKRNKESYCLVFNIGSGSVSGGIISSTPAEGVKMLYYTRDNFPFQEQISVPRHLEAMQASLAKAAEKIRAEGFKKIGQGTSPDQLFERVFYMFSSPWSVSQTKIIRVREPKAFSVTEAYVNRLIDEQEKQFKTEIAKAGAIIEKKIIQVKLNGYPVDRPAGQSVKELDVAVFMSAVPQDILNSVEQAVAKTFHLKNIWCHSLSLALLSVIRNLFPQHEDFIHLDISEEVTDITIVKDNIPVTTATIPLGRNDFIRELSLNLQVTDEIADSMIKMHSTKTNDELAALKMSVAMDAAAKNWLTKIFEVLDGFKDRVYVPEFIFLVSSSDLVPFLKEKLQKHDFKVLLIDNRKISPPLPGDDIIYKLELMFLDNLYKI
jgi:hypothetical protein